MDESILGPLFVGGTPWRLVVNGRNVWAEPIGRQVGDNFELGVLNEELWKFNDPPVAPGTRLTAEIVHETGIYNLTLEYAEIIQGAEEAILTVRLAEDAGRIQRRETFRVRLLLDARMRSGDEFSKEFDALVRDLSEGGIRVTAGGLKSPLPLGSEVIVVFYAMALGGMSVKSEVRWCKPQRTGYELGIRFGDLDAASAARLHRYLWDIQKERRSVEQYDEPV